MDVQGSASGKLEAIKERLYKIKDGCYKIRDGFSLDLKGCLKGLNDSQKNNIIIALSLMFFHLKKLDLSENELRSVPSQIKRFQQLERLNLSYNKLESFPVCVGCCWRLKYLNVSYNAFKKPKEQDKKIPEKTTEKSGEYELEIVRDFHGQVDPFYLTKKDPNYAYRFLRDDSKTGGKNLSIKTSNLLFQKGGWQLCPREHLVKIGLEKEISPDGFLRRGDTILSFIPKKLFKEKEKYKMERAAAPMKSVKRLLKRGDARVGGREIHETMRGLQTKESLRM